MEVDNETNALSQILSIIKENTPYDFTRYKTNSLLRRIKRRMTKVSVESLDEYITYLNNNRNEIKLLTEDLFISVTTFFRDTDVFNFIENEVLDVAFSDHQPTRLKVWVPACATGEEAYTWAILIKEYLKEHDTDTLVQIFGTDISPNAIAKARTGVYSEAIKKQVPPVYLNAYFSKEEDEYRVVRDIRDMVIFSEHDITTDPPFSNMNIVSCRNLSTYLDSSLQQQVFSLINYALTPKGILVVGKTESLGEVSDLFAPLHSDFKIFQHERYDVKRSNEWIPKNTPKKLSTKERLEEHASPLGQLHQKVVLDRFMPPSVLINHRGEILHIQGKTGQYLEMSTGKPSGHVVDNAREELKSELSYAIRHTIKQRKEIIVPNIAMQPGSRGEYINLIVTPVEGHPEQPDLLSVVFQAVTTGEQYTEGEVSTMDAQEIEQELIETQPQLRDTISALEESNREEQSTNEELEASQEALQSSNKLLREKVKELDCAHSDIKNLLNSTNVIILFLDTQLRITRYTPQLQKVIDLEELSTGGSIQKLKTILAYNTLTQDARQVLETQQTIQREVATSHNLYYWLTINPYRNVQNEVGGVTITFTDITDKKQREEELANYRDNLEQLVKGKTEALLAKENQFLNIVNNVPGIVLRYRLDAEGNGEFIYLSDPTEDLWEVTIENALKNPDIVWAKVLEEDLAEMMESIVRSAQEQTLWDHQWRFRTESGDVKWLHGIGEPSRLVDGSTVWDTLVLDITEKRLSELALEDKTALLEKTEELAKIGSWEWDVKQDKTYWSKEIYKIFGIDPNKKAPTLEEYALFLSSKSFETIKESSQRAVQTGEPYELELTIIRENGELRFCYKTGIPKMDEQGQVTHLHGSLQDITVRKKAKLALQESTENYKNIANNIPGLVLRYKINPNGSNELLFLSKGVELVYEISQADAIEDVSLMWKLIHPDDLDWYTESIRQSADELSNWNVQHRLLMPDGRVKWINGRGIPRKMPDGSLVWDTIGLDITQQKEAEEQRKVLKEQLDLAIATAQIGVWTLDLDTKKLNWNDELLEIYGISRETFENQLDSWQHLVHADDRDRADQELEKAFQGEPVFDVHFRIVRPSGDIRHINAAASPMTENGKIVGLVGVNLDITDFKQSEAQLTQAKITAEANEESIRLKNKELKHTQRALKSTTEQLDLAIKTARIGVLAHDLSTQKLEWNDELLKIYGVSNEELEANPSLIKTQIHPNDQKHAVQELEKTYAGQPVSDVRFRVTRPNGEIRYIDAAASPIIENGSVTTIVGINLDITEYKRIESQLTLAKEQAEANESKVVQKNEELKKTNEELDRFVYSVSHDLRAPIASSIGLTELSLSADSADEVHEYDRLRLQTLHKLDTFIQDILNYSRNSRVPVKPEPINFEEVIDTILIEYHTEIVEGMAKIEKDIQTDGEFKGDRLRINIVLNNLLSNAFKFKKSYENLVVDIKVKADSHSATLEISDNGIGIDKESQSRIYDMFYRASAQQEGSGIGLYILKECVDKMEGTINLKSERGKGTTFIIQFPGLGVA